MSIKISLKKSLNIKSVKNHVFFTNENFKISELSKLPIFKFSSFITKSVSASNLVKKNILSITFTTTKDLDACFPASIARKCYGLDSVAFLDCQQMYVTNDVEFCIRVMAQVLYPANNPVKHPYLRGAAKLRTDRC